MKLTALMDRNELLRFLLIFFSSEKSLLSAIKTEPSLDEDPEKLLVTLECEKNVFDDLCEHFEKLKIIYLLDMFTEEKKTEIYNYIF